MTKIINMHQLCVKCAYRTLYQQTQTPHFPEYTCQRHVIFVLISVLRQSNVLYWVPW